MLKGLASLMLTCANSCRVFCALLLVALTLQRQQSNDYQVSCLRCGLPVSPLNRLLQPEISPTPLSSLTSNISVPSPAQSRSELIIAPPPPWPFSCCESSTPQQPSTTVVAAFITPKQTAVQGNNGLKKPSDEMRSIISDFEAEKPPLAQPEPEPDFDDIIFESFNQRQESGGLFLEEDDSKRDTIKRCPPG